MGVGDWPLADLHQPLSTNSALCHREDPSKRVDNSFRDIAQPALSSYNSSLRCASGYRSSTLVEGECNAIYSIQGPGNTLYIPWLCDLPMASRPGISSFVASISPSSHSIGRVSLSYRPHNECMPTAAAGPCTSSSNYKQVRFTTTKLHQGLGFHKN